MVRRGGHGADAESGTILRSGKGGKDSQRDGLGRRRGEVYADGKGKYGEMSELNRVRA
jgi:hypothetical protein